MRILWVSHIIPYPPKSGVHQRSYHLLRAVSKRNAVDLLAFIQEPWLKIFYRSRTEALDDCRQHLLESCESVAFYPIEKLSRRFGKLRTALEGLIPPNCYTTDWLLGPDAVRSFSERGRHNQYDLVHFDTISLAPYRKFFATTPATLGHHNVESQLLQRRSENEPNFVKRWYFRRESQKVRAYESRIANEFSLHITCSELDSSRLRQIAPDVNAISIPNGVDTTYFAQQASPSSPHSLIFVGSLNWYPNVEAMMYLLREIWPMLKARVPDARLDIVGSAPPQKLLDLAASSIDVRVHGFVTDIRPMMDAATLYVCPIRDGGGTKLKLLDAFAMAKCVIAHPIACEGIDVTPGRNIVLADSPEDFVNRIADLFSDPAARARIGKAARGLVLELYSFEKIGERLCDAFSGMLRGPSLTGNQDDNMAAIERR